MMSVGISDHSRNVGRARRCRSSRMKPPMRRDLRRTKPNQEGARPHGLASGETLSVGLSNAWFSRTKPSTMRWKTECGAFASLSQFSAMGHVLSTESQVAF